MEKLNLPDDFWSWMNLKATLKTFYIYWVLDFIVKNLLSPCIHSHSCILTSNRNFINLSFIPHLILNNFHVLHFNWFRCFHWQKPAFLLCMIVCVLCLRKLKRPILEKWYEWVLFLRSRFTTFMFCVFSKSLWFDQNFGFYKDVILWKFSSKTSADQMLDALHQTPDFSVFLTAYCQLRIRRLIPVIRCLIILIRRLILTIRSLSFR